MSPSVKSGDHNKTDGNTEKDRPVAHGRPNETPQSNKYFDKKLKNRTLPEPDGDGRRKLGADGEARAANYLRRRGYLILESNVRYAGVEVDLIVRRGAWVAFVEVKTRRSTRFGSPQLAVDARKQARLVRAAKAWLAAQRTRTSKVRFDVVACLVTRRPDRDHWEIEHFTAAFDATGHGDY